MTELLTASQMRCIEQAAIDSGAVTGLELMERAGAGVVAAIFDTWPDLALAAEVAEVGGAAPSAASGGAPAGISGKRKHKALVLCGPGNNGGDGFVVARLLAERGWEVEVCLYGDPTRLPPDAAVNFARWCAMGSVEINPEVNPGWRTPERWHGAILVDALFGTGLSRPLSASFDALAAMTGDAVQGWRGVVAVDLPSGLCADSGRRLSDPGARPVAQMCGQAFCADLTVTFHRRKRGHVLGASFMGRLDVVDIGLDGCEGSEQVREVGPADVGPLDKSRRRSGAHKFDHGHALVLCGGPGRTGAARLAARAALRVGAGLVTLGVPGAAQMEVASHVTSVMVARAGTPEEVGEVLQDKRINAVCLGPGLGLDRARALCEAVGGHPTRPVVLDADALTAYADAPEALFEHLHARCVLTPHGGEFARLFPDIAAKLSAPAVKGPAYSKIDATREAAARAGCTILFKGPDTVIANEAGACSVNAAVHDRAAPWLATAGAGDVLAGFITGLLARGFDPVQAAQSAAWLHVECARSFGPGLIAEDLPEELPKVLSDLETFV